MHEHQQLAKFQASARQIHSRVFRRRVVSDERCQCTFCATQQAWPKQEFRAPRRYPFHSQRERYKNLADAILCRTGSLSTSIVSSSKFTMLFKAVAVVFCLLAPFVVATADNPGQFCSFSSHLLLDIDITLLVDACNGSNHDGEGHTCAWKGGNEGSEWTLLR